MNEEMTGKCLQQVEHNLGRLPTGQKLTRQCNLTHLQIQVSFSWINPWKWNWQYLSWECGYRHQRKSPSEY